MMKLAPWITALIAALSPLLASCPKDSSFGHSGPPITGPFLPTHTMSGTFEGGWVNDNLVDSGLSFFELHEDTGVITGTVTFDGWTCPTPLSIRAQRDGVGASGTMCTASMCVDFSIGFYIVLATGNPAFHGWYSITSGPCAGDSGTMRGEFVSPDGAPAPSPVAAFLTPLGPIVLPSELIREH